MFESWGLLPPPIKPPALSPSIILSIKIFSIVSILVCTSPIIPPAEESVLDISPFIVMSLIIPIVAPSSINPINPPELLLPLNIHNA